MERPVEKAVENVLLESGAILACRLEQRQVESLVRLVDLLLDWNRKISLTAITNPVEVAERHLLDSLAAAAPIRRCVERAGAKPFSLLDLGAGAGFPSLPLAVQLQDVRFTLVESVGKKVGFLKAAIAALGLGNAKALQARVAARPNREGIEPANAVACRAFLPLEEWLELAPAYVRPGGLVLAMLGTGAVLPEHLPEGLLHVETHEYTLPICGARRRVVVLQTAK